MFQFDVILRLLHTFVRMRISREIPLPVCLSPPDGHTEMFQTGSLMFSLPPGTEGLSLHLYTTETSRPPTMAGLELVISPLTQQNSSTADQLGQYNSQWT